MYVYCTIPKIYAVQWRNDINYPIFIPLHIQRDQIFRNAFHHFYVLPFFQLFTAHMPSSHCTELSHAEANANTTSQKTCVFACILPRGARIITPKCVCAYPFRTSTALKIIRKPHAMRKTETNRSREPFSLFGVMILRLLYVFLVFHSHVHI